MDKFNTAKLRSTPRSDSKTSRQIIEEFFYTYHPAQAEEYFREISAVLRTPGMTITKQEHHEYMVFFDRINELIKANYLQQS